MWTDNGDQHDFEIPSKNVHIKDTITFFLVKTVILILN